MASSTSSRARRSFADSLGPLVSEHRIVSGMAVFVTLAVALLVPIVTLIFCSRRGWLRWPQLTALWAFVLATFAYLMWDDPTVRRPLTMDELAPSLPGDEAIFQIFLRYATNSPVTKAVKTPKLLIGLATGDIVTKPDKWT